VQVPQHARLMKNGNVGVAVWRSNGGAIRPWKGDFQGSTPTLFSIGDPCSASRARHSRMALRSPRPRLKLKESRQSTTKLIDRCPILTTLAPPPSPAGAVLWVPQIHSSGTSIANVATDTAALQREMADLGSDCKTARLRDASEGPRATSRRCAAPTVQCPFRNCRRPAAS
jgi:hypothetical protein